MHDWTREVKRQTINTHTPNTRGSSIEQRAQTGRVYEYSEFVHCSERQKATLE